MSPSRPTLSDRHALVCGASAGIGRAVALALAGRGAALTVLARREGLLEALLPELEGCGATIARALPADLDRPEEAAARVAAHIEAVGPIHILVNNNGGPAAGPLLEATLEDFRTAFRGHLHAAHLLLRAVLPGMRAAGWGRVVNILSTSVREPIQGLGVSNAVRAAMASWAKSLSRELPPGITINNVLPGFTDTERLTSLAGQMAGRQGRTPEEVRESWLAGVPEGRLVAPWETAAAVAFLASDEAAAIRGQSLAVDGGRLASI